MISEVRKNAITSYIVVFCNFDPHVVFVVESDVFCLDSEGLSGGVGSTGIGLIVLGIGWLLLLVVIVLVVAAYIWRRKHKYRSLSIL